MATDRYISGDSRPFRTCRTGRHIWWFERIPAPAGVTVRSGAAGDRFRRSASLERRTPIVNAELQKRYSASGPRLTVVPVDQE